jgi:chromatin structure-remodeling complex subunit SFH1
MTHCKPRLPLSSVDVLLDQSRRPTTLIPIRVELETDTHRIRDAFVWNLNEQAISPAAFARIFCADLDLPMHPYAEQVEGAIRSQIEEWEGVAGVDLRPPLPQPALDDGPARFYSITNEEEKEETVEDWELLGEEYREGDGEEVPDCRVILEVRNRHSIGCRCPC